MIVKLINDKQVTFGSTTAGVVIISTIASAWLESSKRHWEKCPSLSKMEIKTDCTQQLPLVGVTKTTVYIIRHTVVSLLLVGVNCRGFNKNHNFKVTYFRGQWFFQYNLLLDNAHLWTLNFVEHVHNEIHDNWYSTITDET